MNDPVISVNVDAKLALNKYNVDEGHAHIALSDDADRAEFRKLVLACPAALYKIDEDGGLSFDYVRHLPHPVQQNHRRAMGVPPAHHGRGISVRVKTPPVAMPASTRGGMAGQYPHILLFV